MHEDLAQDHEDACAICGRKLTVQNRSTDQEDLCKWCAGENESSQALDDFK